jgi:hypothetical protein
VVHRGLDDLPDRNLALAFRERPANLRVLRNSERRRVPDHLVQRQEVPTIFKSERPHSQATEIRSKRREPEISFPGAVNSLSVQVLTKVGVPDNSGSGGTIRLASQWQAEGSTGPRSA